MRLTLAIDTSSGRRRIELLVRALTDLQPPLRAFGAYLRARGSKAASTLKDPAGRRLRNRPATS